MREGDLIATVDVAPLQAAAFLPAAPSPAGARAEAPGRSPAAAEVPGWLEAPGAEQAPPVLDVRVSVTWEGAPRDAETQEPAAVQRRTFALNPTALAALESGEDGNPPPEATE
jgi:hypothetical protein